LRIAYQNRPDIFALNIQLPELLYQEVIEIEERLNVEGEVLTPLNTNLAQQQLQILHQQGFRSIAIESYALIHRHNVRHQSRCRPYQKQ
jgi:5-oxoprolinase (ATP-hydrolysing)